MEENPNSGSCASVGKNLERLGLLGNHSMSDHGATSHDDVSDAPPRSAVDSYCRRASRFHQGCFWNSLWLRQAAILLSTTLKSNGFEL
jgi:hypothetical protein